MTSLWNKLTLSSKTSLPINSKEASSKRTGKQSLSARSRKSLSLILPDVFGDPTNDKKYVLILAWRAELICCLRNAPTVGPDLNCEEAGNYPIYDPEDPDHNTAHRSSANTAPRSRSWSPLKQSLRSKSPSPTRLMTSSRKALNDFAQSVKATAAAMRPSTPPSLLRDVSPMGRDSEKSVKSKKSVHWHSSDSTAAASGTNGQSSPKDIVKKSSPLLPEMVYSDHFLGSKVALTARPPPTPVLIALEQADQRPQNIELQCPDLVETTQPPLLTPMPGTNLPLEDPFDDAAAVGESHTNIFEDPDCASGKDGCSSEPEPHIEVLIGVAPSSIATVAVSDCLEQRPLSRASSNTYNADSDSLSSEEIDTEVSATTRVYPKSQNTKAMGKPNLEDLGVNDTSRELQSTIPKIEISVPVEDDAPKKHLGELQSSSKVGSAVSLGSAHDDSDKENHCHGDQAIRIGQDSKRGHPNCSQGCRVSSLTEPVKHDVSPPDSPPRQPPLAQLTTARKLPPFHLQANITSTSPPHGAPAFRFMTSSEESMSIVDETEYSWQARKDLLDVKDARSKTTVPATVPIPENPMPEIS